MLVIGIQPDNILYSGHLHLQFRRHGRRTNGHFKISHVGRKAIDLISMRMEPVIAEFIPNPEQDKNTAGHPDGQAGDINGCKCFVANNVPERDFEVVEQHGKKI